MPCCVIGSTSDFGSDSLGSSPSEAVKLYSCSPIGRGGCLKNSLLCEYAYGTLREQISLGVPIAPMAELEDAADLKSVLF